MLKPLEVHFNLCVYICIYNKKNHTLKDLLFWNEVIRYGNENKTRFLIKIFRTSR